MADDEQIIIVKKKGGHGGHHGGAWKVAYADFVTAMMALFIVLWLMNSSKPVQEAVGGYFRDPNGTAQKTGTALGGAGDAGPIRKEDMSKLKEEIMSAMGKLALFDKLKNQVEMTITSEGLRIELIEDPNGTFFENGKAQPTASLQKLLQVLAGEAGKLPNTISIEGHTDAKPFSDTSAYGNWELSTDRANTARRLMQANGLRPNQVVQVRGYADQNLRKPLQPQDASNRRVTVVIQYVAKPGQASMVSGGTLPDASKLVASPAWTPKEPGAKEPAAKEPAAKEPAAGTKKPEK